MAVVIILEWHDVAPEEYEQARESVKWDTNKPDGLQFHVAAFDANGLRVTDVFDSPEQFQAFVDDRLIPATKALGIFNGQPKIEVLPVHAINKP